MYRKELVELGDLGFLVPVNEPTEWVNGIVLSEPTNNKGEVTKIKLCLDARDLNTAVRREHYYTKTTDEVVIELYAAKFISVDWRLKGYWRVPWEKASSFLITFNTPSKSSASPDSLSALVSHKVYSKDILIQLLNA